MMPKINFGAGPAALPREAVARAREDLVDFEGTGISVVELSHRGPAYEKVQARALTLLRELLAVPDTHEVLVLQGGARTQFAMLPLNLLPSGRFAQYVVTGTWARYAYDEARFLADVRIAADSREPDGSYRRIPTADEIAVDQAAVYLHLCSNNTIYGTQWQTYPDTGSVPLVADMTSDLLSRPIDISRFGVIYASAQKNLGPAGATVVIIRKSLIEHARTDIPSVWRYAVHTKSASLYYTPSTFSIAAMRHVLEHAVAVGGLPAIAAANREKAQRLYAALDARPDVYRVPAGIQSRSQMNVVFFLNDADQESRFLAEASRRGMIGLKGHRSIGGVRASIYNWISLADVEALVDLIRTFEA